MRVLHVPVVESYDGVEVVHQVDSLSLGTRDRLDDPDGILVLLELLHEDVVLGRQLVGERHDVHVNLRTVLIFLSDRVALLLHVLLEALDVLDHQVLSRQLSVVLEVVEYLHLAQTVPVLGVPYLSGVLG